MARSKTGSRSSRTNVRGKPITRPARPKLTSLTTSTALESNKAVVGIHKSGVTNARRHRASQSQIREARSLHAPEGLVRDFRLDDKVDEEEVSDAMRDRRFVVTRDATRRAHQYLSRLHHVLNARGRFFSHCPKPIRLVTRNRNVPLGTLSFFKHTPARRAWRRRGARRARA